MRKPATRETKAGACHLGLAQNKTGFSLLQCPSIGHEPTTTSAARRARAANALATPPPERERAQWRNRVCAHTQAGCLLETAAGTWEHDLVPKREASRWCSGLPKDMGRLQPARRGARAPQALVMRLLPRDASAVAQSRVRTRASGLCWRPRLVRRSTALHQRREATRWCSGLS